MRRAIKVILSLVLVASIPAAVYVFFRRKPKIDAPLERIFSFEQAVPLLEQCHAGTLVLFDIGETLLTTRDAAARGPANYPLGFMMQAALRHPSLLLPQSLEHYRSIMRRDAERFVIEPAVKGFIAELKKRGCLVLALSGMESGKSGVIQDVPAWTDQALRAQGIELSTDLPNTAFAEFRPRRRAHPRLYQGIIACNGQDKGQVLAALLTQLPASPTGIVFFDNDETELARVARVCQQRGMIFQGFLYKSPTLRLAQWNSTRALKQLDYLIREERWLSDAEADLLLSSDRSHTSTRERL